MSQFPDNLKMVIFDIDGTLYNQKKLRWYMAIELALYYLIRPWKMGEVQVLMHFRKEREKNALLPDMNHEIAHNQYQWCQSKVNRPISEIKEIVAKWMHQKPLKHLPKCIYQNCANYIQKLNNAGVTTCAYSDFEGDAKLRAMNLNIQHCYSSEQAEINTLKPSAKGINYIATQHQIQKKDIVFIGDRDELDGTCAENAGVHFYKINRESANEQYEQLLNE